MNQQPQPMPPPMGAPRPPVNKWLLVVFIIVVLGAGGYFGWYFWKGPGKKVATTTPTATTSTTTTSDSATTTDETADWKTFTNSEYGFQLTFNDKWQGYKAAEKKPAYTGATDSIVFSVPTKDSSWKSQENGLWNPFTIYVFTPAQWAVVKDSTNAENASNPDYIPTDLIKQNSSYVFTYNTAQDNPSDGEAILTDVKNIISTFQFTQ